VRPKTFIILALYSSPPSLSVRALANERAPFVRIDGSVKYSNITSDEAYNYYDGDIVFNNEEDIHAALLTVEQVTQVFSGISDPPC
jgi:ATP-binding cassette subfamily G (WHITE) protein 2 (SNQ2)